jgi:hypothetical protein
MTTKELFTKQICSLAQVFKHLLLTKTRQTDHKHYTNPLQENHLTTNNFNLSHKHQSIQLLTLTMTTPPSQHSEVKTFPEKAYCWACDKKPTLNVPYTWDSEKKLWGREESNYEAKCPECPKFYPNSRPGDIVLMRLPKWRVEALEKKEVKAKQRGCVVC